MTKSIEKNYENLDLNTQRELERQLMALEGSQPHLKRASKKELEEYIRKVFG